MSEQRDNDLHNASLKGPMEFTDLVARIIKDCSLFLLIGLSLFSFMAITGYDTKDPGWSHVAYQPVVSNWTGKFGALWADIAFSFIGLSAWIVPLILFFPCIRLYRRKEVSLLDSLPFVMLRVVGAIVLVFTVCALLSLHLSNKELNYPFTSGGIIGQAFSEWMVSWFSIHGSSVILWFSAAIGLTLLMELSWRDLLIALGGAILFGWNKVISSISSRSENLNELAIGEVDDNSYKCGANLYQEDAIEPVKTSSNDANKAPNSDLTVESTQLNTAQEYLAENSQPSFMDRMAKKFAKTMPEPRIVPTDIGLNTPSNSKPADIAQQETAEHEDDVKELDSSFNKIEAHLAQPLPNLTPVNENKPLGSKPDNNQVGNEFAKVQENPIQQKQPSDNSHIDQNSPESSPKLADSINTVDVAVVANKTSNNEQAVSEQEEINKRQLKIVPLSETHLSTLSEESAFSNQKQPAKIEPVALLPDVGLLDPPELQTEEGYTQEQLEDMSRLLEVKLKDFGVIVEVVEVNPGPVITRFEIQPAPGVKSSKIVNLAKDLARSLAVMSVRVVEVIPGKSVMGIEIPNISRKMVRLSEVLTADVYQDAASHLTLALGNDIAGNPVVANLAKMPHLLVAGTTGSGKSVGVNALILSLLFKAGPQDVRLMLVDPKMLELSIYEGIPHLLTPVITDMKEAAGGLRWCVAEMERRYKLMSKMGVRNLDGFNDKIREGVKSGSPLRDPLWNPEEYGQSPGTPAPQLEVLPYIVVVIDEFADMMMIVGKKVEELIARIAQKARAAGIHLILATQRPSVDVITGLIKANVPTRIAFQVSSKIDSRTILDQGGSENLLGNGDMLFLPAGTSVPSRVHGAFVSDDEVHRTVEAWKKQGKPEFIDIQMSDESGAGASGSLFEDDEQDVLYDEAVAFITSTGKVSISSVQRKFKIGYNRAARIVESMEAAGVITSAGTNGQREVIAAPPPEF
jgi:S-DNA-T family DNA segregation ATPase FtsK/SpoIIIE